VRRSRDLLSHIGGKSPQSVFKRHKQVRYLMRVVKCHPQCSYKHGENMCSTAALCMCIAMVGKKHCQDLRKQVENVMVVASNAHQRFKNESGNQLASVADIVNYMGLGGFMKDVGFHEYIICGEGCNEMHQVAAQRLADGSFVAEHEEPTSCLVARTLFTRCLVSHSRKGSVVAAVLTCNGHSVAVSSNGGEYSLFDSGPSFLVVGMNDTEFNDKLDDIIVDQCDVTVIYSKS
jgi:hypothetical protein